MASPPPPNPPPRKLDFVAALLSYLVPGLGQVVQGRIGKGVLYFVCLYGLFVYGMALGNWKNVWLADTRNLAPANLPVVGETKGLLKDLSYRKEFVGQFWIGSFAWPAVVQYLSTPPQPQVPEPSPVLGTYMQAPTEDVLNELQRNGDKGWDLGWVFTVIAGALNVLVIYDALAGPVVKDEDLVDGKPKPGGGL